MCLWVNDAPNLAHKTRSWRAKVSQTMRGILLLNNREGHLCGRRFPGATVWKNIPVWEWAYTGLQQSTFKLWRGLTGENYAAAVKLRCGWLLRLTTFPVVA